MTSTSLTRSGAVLLALVVVLGMAVQSCGGPPSLPTSVRSAVLNAKSDGARMKAFVAAAHRLDTKPDTRIDDRAALRLASTVAQSVPQLGDALVRGQRFQGASPRAIVALLRGISHVRQARRTIYEAVLRDELRQSDRIVETFAQTPPAKLDQSDPKGDLNSQIKNMARAHGMLVEALSHKGSDQAGSEKQVPVVEVARCQAQPGRTCSVLPSYPVITDCVVLAVYLHTPADRLPKTMTSRPALTTDARGHTVSDWLDSPGPLLSIDAIRDVYSSADSGWYDGKVRARELARRPS